MSRFQRWFIIAVIPIICLTAAMVFASAEDQVYTYTAGGFQITSDQSLNSSDYVYKDGVLHIYTTKPIKIKNKKSSATNDVITLEDISGTADITLAGVNISGVKKGKPAIELPGQRATINLTIEEGTENTLVGGKGHAGLEKASLTFSEHAGPQYDPSCIEIFFSSWLFIQGKGTLTAKGGEDAPGIGGRQGKPYSDQIYVFDANVIAYGGNGAAGIGGGRHGCGGGIFFFNATVEAHGGKGGAGIGSGAELEIIEEPLFRISSYASSVTLNNSIVEAHGGENAPGIGDGQGSGGGGSLLMYNSSVAYAFGGTGAPAIGSVLGEYSLEVDNTNWLALTAGSGAEKTIMCSDEIYPLSISCSTSDKVYIDGQEMTNKINLLGKSVYTVKPKGNYEVKIGDRTTYYCFDEKAGKFVETDSPEKYSLTGSSVNTASTVELVEAGVIVLLAVALILVLIKYKQATAGAPAKSKEQDK